MLTVDRVDGLHVVIYPNDHRPAHVHVMGNGSEAVFNLRCPAGPPQVRENYGFSKPDVSRIQAALGKRLALLCAAWKDLHGSP